MSKKYDQHTCGHLSTNDPWGKDLEPRMVQSLCVECRATRIGETIRFARFGTAPANGISRNGREQTAEAGMSVYEISENRINLVGFHFGITERALHIGTGKIVGWGSDGEPVVAEFTMKKATKKQHNALMGN
jgi:hypothetical protein